MNKYDELLEQFCNPDIPMVSRPMPANDGAITTATNGHFLIAVPSRKVQGEYKPSTIENPLNVLQITPRLAVPRPFDTNEIIGCLSRIEKVRLEQIADCPNCEGSGKCECRCEHCHKCQACDGIGNLGLPAYQAKFCGFLVNPFYLFTIFKVADELNNGDLLLTALPKTDKEPLCFEIKDARIALMPYRTEFSDQRIIKIAE